ncbi:hypothetical protein, partial [Thiolapillus sp.]|uniref:hypothetical protein n=1 Tax=Thiolapillus sp. TaxID=2017437 RepID=UPI003AF751F0
VPGCLSTLPTLAEPLWSVLDNGQDFPVLHVHIVCEKSPVPGGDHLSRLGPTGCSQKAESALKPLVF